MAGLVLPVVILIVVAVFIGQGAFVLVLRLPRLGNEYFLAVRMFAAMRRLEQ